jgi:uncharacterized surface protein with fasciclin (FAS1) repeats
MCDMKKILNHIIPAILLISGVLFIASLSSCKHENLTLTTTSDVNMYTYLDNNPDQFSLFKQIVDKAGYASFLNTYGSYTLFATNNDGVNAYLKATGKASVDAIDAATAKNIISISLIADTIGTQLFTDGKMRTPTTSGQYLITGAANGTGGTSTTINKQANLVKGNIRVGNGLIHIIDNVLIPATTTLAKTIEQSGKYGIFTAALIATGFYDSLNVAATANTNISRKYLTVIAESDDVFRAAGYTTYTALKNRYSTKNDPKNHADSLWLFVAYHVWPELSYLSDIASNDSHPTLAPLEISSSVLIGQNVLLNNDIFNGIQEQGQQLDRANSDVSANNGVLHAALANYAIKVRLPSPVYFDVANQPEILRTPGLYRGIGKTQAFTIGQLANIIPIAQGDAGARITYKTEPAVLNAGDYFYNNDYMIFGDRFRVGSNGMNSVEFRTPVIVKGRYKIWVDYKRQSNQLIPVTFDGIPLPNAFNPADGLNEAETERAAESRGFKWYSDSPVVPTTNTSAGYNNHVGRLLGVVDILTTDRHSIKFTATAALGAAASIFWIDVIEFRPIDMDQLHPRLGHNGNLVP